MKRHLGQLIALLFGLVLWGISIVYQAPAPGIDLQEWCRILSNAALIPGILLLGLTGMLRISEEGVFDGLRYSLSSLFAHFRGDTKRYPSYYDYIHRERKQRVSYPMLLPGLFFLVMAILLTLLYYV